MAGDHVVPGKKGQGNCKPYQERQDPVRQFWWLMKTCQLTRGLLSCHSWGSPGAAALLCPLPVVERKGHLCPHQHKVVQPQKLAGFFTAGKVFKVHFKTVSNCEMQSLQVATAVNPKQLPSKPRLHLNQKLL